MKLLQKLERKYGKYAIPNLMNYIIGMYVLGWFLQVVNPQIYEAALAFDAEKILHGQVWRLITFIIMPPDGSTSVFLVFTLYLYYLLGNALERAWGSFRFNVYFLMGILFHIVAGFLVYFVFGVNYPLTTYYLNLSLFFAFAMLYPDMELLLFFLIPIKIKWLALVDALYFVATIVAGFLVLFVDGITAYQIQLVMLRLGIVALPEIAVCALVSFLNFLVFFFMTRNYKKYSPGEVRRRTAYKQQVRQKKRVAFHKCDICGRTSDSHPQLAFRYCTKCAGNHEYCEEHIFVHEHVK